MNKKFFAGDRGIQDTQTILRSYLHNVLKSGDMAIDATAGRGRDTLFLAQCVGPEGKVYAFDIQEEAIIATKELLADHKILDRVELYHDTHSNIPQYVTKGIKAAVFNLGYLPSSNHRITTKPETTLIAIQEVLKLLTNKGIIIITVYTGHEGGQEESKALMNYVTRIPKRDFSVIQGIYLNQGELSPYWIMIQKNREDNG